MLYIYYQYSIYCTYYIYNCDITYIVDNIYYTEYFHIYKAILL